jgi:MFS family permease
LSSLEPTALADDTVDWRRNLVAVYVGQFAALFGLSFSRPFLPIFLGHELGVHDPHQLAFWTGVSSAVLGVGIGVAGPIWGMVADRTGRKPMLIRAMLGGAVMVGLMSFSQSPLEYTVEWLLFGALSSTVPVATALIASETPRQHVGYALGMMTSAGALGGSLGPAVAGFVAATLGLRATYIVGAGIEASAIIPVVWLVREVSFRRVRASRRDAVGSLAARLPRGTLKAILVLLAALALFMTATAAMQPLTVLRLLQLAPTQATLLTGIAFGAFGVASAVAGATYSRFAKWIGFRRIAMLAVAVMAIAFLGASIAPSPTLIVVALAVSGLVGGSVSPAISSMLGFETPIRIQGTVFGFIATAIAIGLSVGPLLGGAVASVYDAAAGIKVAAGVAAILVIVLAVAGREPAHRQPQTVPA